MCLLSIQTAQKSRQESIPEAALLTLPSPLIDIVSQPLKRQMSLQDADAGRGWVAKESKHTQDSAEWMPHSKTVLRSCTELWRVSPLPPVNISEAGLGQHKLIKSE